MTIFISNRTFWKTKGKKMFTDKCHLLFLINEENFFFLKQIYKVYFNFIIFFNP